jgi:transposase
MLKVKFTEEDLRAMHYERFNNPHPRVMLKMEVLYLKCKGYKNDVISDITGVCGNTIREYLKQFSEGGLSQLKAVNFNRPISDLRNYTETIEQYFTENPPRSIGEAAAKIRELTGLERSETQVRKFLKSLDFRFRKVGSVPAKSLTEEKKTNRENFWIRNSILY